MVQQQPQRTLVQEAILSRLVKNEADAAFEVLQNEVYRLSATNDADAAFALVRWYSEVSGEGERGLIARFPSHGLRAMLTQARWRAGIFWSGGPVCLADLRQTLALHLGWAVRSGALSGRKATELIDAACDPKSVRDAFANVVRLVGPEHGDVRSATLAFLESPAMRRVDGDAVD